jgi:hypothetical protein
MDRVLVEISRVQSQLRAAESSRGLTGYVLERFLGDLKTDAETVLGDADHLASLSGDEEDGEWEDEPSAVGPSSSNPTRNDGWTTVGQTATSTPPIGNSGKQQAVAPIMFTNAQGRRYPIPYAACRTWAVSAVGTILSAIPNGAA